jgi:hypothetical protein
MATTTPRSRKIAKITSVAAGFGLGIAAVLGFSSAAFSAQTAPNGQNNWATSGSVTLTEQFTAPMFSFGLDGVGKPTSNGSQLSTTDSYLDTTGINGRQINITYKGQVDADVRMFVGSKGTATNGLDAHTLVTVTRDVDGPGGAAPVPVYTDAKLSTMPTDYAGAGTAELSHWNVAHNDANKVATYTVSIKADASAPADSTVRGVEFKWEAQQR